MADYKDRLRPQIHYSPRSNWMNDPNGCVYFNGIYHLHYQYNPHGISWGKMHWGHAVSRDLVHWEEQPIALFPDDESGMVFSGSSIVDQANVSGFFPDGKGLLIFHTNHIESARDDGAVQHQSLVWSDDNGRSWNKWAENPVIENPGLKDFRDPRVFYHTDTACWHMVLSGGDRIYFYFSEDLKKWEQTGEFITEPDFGTAECPDLLHFRASSGEDVWVLVISFLCLENPGQHTVRYYCGSFDGEVFSSFSDGGGAAADFGRDFYAAQSWNGISDDDGRKIWIAWSSHWAYAEKEPTAGWRGVMSIPRELSLIEENSRFFLRQTPVKEIEVLRASTQIFRRIQGNDFILNLNSGYSHELLLSVENAADTSFELEFNYSEADCWSLRWNGSENRLYMERGALSGSGFDDFFMEPVSVDVFEPDKLDIRLILDRSIIELFILNGRYTMTSRIFPENRLKSASMRVAGRGRIRELIHHNLNSIW